MFGFFAPLILLSSFGLIHGAPLYADGFVSPGGQDKRFIYGENVEGRCDLRIEAPTRGQADAMRARGVRVPRFRYLAWAPCEDLRFGEMRVADLKSLRLVPESSATIRDVPEGTVLVSISGGESFVALFFDRSNAQRELWIND